MKSFRSHQNKHGPLTEYACDICPKKFTKCYRLNNHMENMHSEKLYDCTICSKAFATMKRLQLHTEKHQIEQPLLPCTICHKVFRSTANLEKHLVKCRSVIKIPCDTATTVISTEYDNALNLSQSIYHRYGALNGYSGHTMT